MAIAAADTRRFIIDKGRELESAFATLTAKNVTITENSFLPFAYREAAANLLTNAALDPVGKIPELKFCAVQVLALALPIPVPAL